MSIRSYRDLLVWQKAMDLVVVCYQLTEKLPPSENFGLSSRIRNFASNVPSYIADGEGRKTNSEYFSRLSLAHGSLMSPTPPPPARPALRRANVDEEARLHVDRRHHAGAGHRREHGDFQRG